MNAASSRFPITVITITYNSAHCVARALTSAAGAAEFIIVDNASTDGSIGATEPFGCKVIANDGNVGFGVACNQAARLATSEFLLFLNPDAVLAPKAIERMLATAERFPNAVAFGPRHELPLDHEVDVTYQKRLARARNRGAKDQAIAGTREVRSLSGAALLCRRSTFAAVGGFDEKFFLYFEDEDLCRRLAQHGPLICADDATVFQLPGTGANLNWHQHFMKYRRYGRSRIYFSKKHGVRFKCALQALEQTAKGVAAFARSDRALAAQHFGRAVGYIEGRFGRLR